MEGFPSLISPPQKILALPLSVKRCWAPGKANYWENDKTVIRSLLCLFRIKFFSSMYFLSFLTLSISICKDRNDYLCINILLIEDNLSC